MSETNHSIFLSKRNVLTLLSKLDRQAEGDSTFCTLIKYDNQHMKYAQTMKSCSITAVERWNSEKHHLGFDGNSIIITRNDLKRLLEKCELKEETPMYHGNVRIRCIENEEYYTERKAGEIYYKDDERVGDK